MTIGGRLVSLFPFFYLCLSIYWVEKMFADFHWWDFVGLGFIIYLLPLILFRIHSVFFPLLEGEYDLSKKVYSPWWASHMFQYPFIALPMLEAFLHFIPGLYSCWIRAWGSKVGKRVLWTPRTEIIDRSLVEVGDSTIVGHLTIMVSHLVETRSGIPKLVLKKVQIGSRVLIGADSQLGPGAVVPDKMQLKPKTRLFWKGEWK